MSKRVWMWALFALYAAVMLWLLFGQRVATAFPPEGSYAENLKSNPLPLQTIRFFLADLFAADPDPILQRNAVINLVGNVVMFVPLGVFYPCLFVRCRRFSRCLLAMALTILAVEAVQFVTTLGSFDTDDVILNLLGGMAGCGIYAAAGRT